MNNKITKQKIEKYFKITGEALKKIKIIAPEKTPLNKIAKDFLDMAQRYFDDAKYFYEKKEDIVLAYGALNYAHGWLDSGARIGIFDVGHDSRLFVVE